jgi:hypothetical protein
VPQSVEHRKVIPPIPYFVGVGQSVASNAVAYSHVVELLGLRSETNLGFPEALLGKDHAEVLIQATEGFDLEVSIVGLYSVACESLSR